MNRYRITILCENTVGPISGTLGEHGFAALIEGDGPTLLFDTGMGETLLHNALRMNKNLRLVDRVILSHGHYDHTGGLLPLLRNCGKKAVLAHPAVFSERYRVKDTGESMPIGIPYNESYLRGMGARFDLDDRFRQVAPDIFLTGEVPRKTPFEKGDLGMFRDQKGGEADRLEDDSPWSSRPRRASSCCSAAAMRVW